MEFFKFLLFGITGVSLIFWVCVISIWHIYTFQRIFSEDKVNLPLPEATLPLETMSRNNDSSFIKARALRPLIIGTSLKDRFKYSRRSFVVADFSPIENGYKTNGLYTTVLLSLGVASMILISYGLRSALILGGIDVS